MNIFSFILLISFSVNSWAGVTEIPSTLENEVSVETVSDDTWMPSNVFEVKTAAPAIKEELQNTIVNVSSAEAPWNADTNPIFKAIRDFIFQSTDGILDPEEVNEDPTEEIVKILEKGIIEATTMFLTPSEDDQLSVTSEDPRSESVSILKIENETPDSLLDRIGLNIMDFSNEEKLPSLSVKNTSTACSTCYNSLEICVQQCFMKHNCNDVERKALTCPVPTSRCNIFTQWAPVNECEVNEDCKSPLLCCNDGCLNRCTSGIWRN